MNNFESPVLKPVSYDKDTVTSNLWSQLKHWRFHGRRWKIVQDWIFWCEHLQLYVKIPAKFTCDGASVPHFLKFMVSSCDGLFYGAIVHDFIYRFNQIIVSHPDHNGDCLNDWYIWEEPGKKMADVLLYQLPKQIEGFLMPNLIAYILKPSYWYAWHHWRKINYKLTTPTPDPDDEGLNSLL